MALPARPLPDPENFDDLEAPPRALPPDNLPPNLPVMLTVRDLSPDPASPSQPSAHALRLVDVPAASLAPQPPKPAEKAPNLSDRKHKKEKAVLRGIKDLQNLQKQTIAVLESVKGALDDIQQVLRSPEATRGMEKQQNAAQLLSKGFAREAVEQAQGAAALLPANPEAHLLLALSLAADQQFDVSLHAARKGLALFDRRNHPLAIEAGLLHALAALGCGAEAVERWSAIIDALPLPVLLENLARIAACFPSENTGGGPNLLDDLVNRRLAREEQNTAAHARSRKRNRSAAGTGADGGAIIETRPDEIPAATLFTGLDAARDFDLPYSHRAILAQIARRLQWAKQPGDVVKFLTECLVPLGNRNLERTTSALGRAAAKRLLHLHADAMTLHRALTKLEMAGEKDGAVALASVLNHWRKAGGKVTRQKQLLIGSWSLVAGGIALLAYVLWPTGASAGKAAAFAGVHMPALWLGPLMIGIGAAVGILAMMGRRCEITLPESRPALTREERLFVKTSAVRRSVHAALAAR